MGKALRTVPRVSLIHFGELAPTGVAKSDLQLQLARMVDGLSCGDLATRVIEDQYL